MRKLLIVGGDSNTDSTYTENVKNNIFSWPHSVADKMDWDLLNVAQMGRSNESIENRVYDAVVENQDRDIVVMVLWSQSIRQSPFDLFNIIFTNDKRQFNEFQTSKFLTNFPGMDIEKWEDILFIENNNLSYNKWIETREYLPKSADYNQPYDLQTKHTYILEQILKFKFQDTDDVYHLDEKILHFNLRSMRRLKLFLDSLGIRSIFKSGLSVTRSIPGMFSPWIQDHDLKQKTLSIKRLNRLNSVCKEKLDFELSDWEEGLIWALSKHGHVMECNHPTQTGHEIIAKEFIKCANY